MIDEQKNNRNYAKSAIDEGEHRIMDAINNTEKRLKDGHEQVNKMARDLDKRAHENPWPVIATVGFGCLLVGLILGKSKD
ncbi:MAG: hypothetical protein JNN05_10315 [Candidatus Omnitrophica bacterium]|nr:hypothetical protein [Candidatus Omnitrophota bacterium]